MYLNIFLLHSSWQLWTHPAPTLGLNWVVSDQLVFAALLKICPDLSLFKTSQVADLLPFATLFGPEVSGLGVVVAHPYSVFLVRFGCGFPLLRTLHLSLSSAHEIFVFPIWHTHFLSSWQGTVCMVLIHLESALAMWRCLVRSDGPSCVASACPPNPSTYSHRTQEHSSFANKQDISVYYVC